MPSTVTKSAISNGLVVTDAAVDAAEATKDVAESHCNRRGTSSDESARALDVIHADRASRSVTDHWRVFVTNYKQY